MAGRAKAPRNVHEREFGAKLLVSLALFAGVTEATEEGHIGHYVVKVLVSIRPVDLLVQVPHVLSVVDLADGNGRKGGRPVEAAVGFKSKLSFYRPLGRRLTS